MPSETPILSVSYNLRPPSSTAAPQNLSATTTHDIPLQVPDSLSESGQNFSAYYAALRGAIAKAKVITGQELTEWRDAVGDSEKEKTGGKKEIEEEGEEAEEEDQEEEAAVKKR